MASRTVDLVAIGPPPTDPFAPAARAWALARALVRRGDRVSVLYPEGPEGDRVPEGVTALPIAVPLRRPGTPFADAEFAGVVGRRLHREAALVLREPAGLGALGVRGPRLIVFAHGAEFLEFDAAAGGGAFLDRLDRWRDRRSLHRLERAALSEAEAIFCDGPALLETLQTEYGLPRERMRVSLPPVPDLPAGPSRAEARGSLGIPPDVPAVVVPAFSDRAEENGLALAREACGRIRALFPGVRLILVGATATAEPGTVGLPRRDGSSFALAFSAADVALVIPTRTGFDPAAVFAMRAGCATIAAATVVLPAVPEGAVRVPVSADAGDVASVLAELVADPAACRELGARGRKYAQGFDPERTLAEVDAALGGR